MIPGYRGVEANLLGRYCSVNTHTHNVSVENYFIECIDLNQSTVIIGDNEHTSFYPPMFVLVSKGLSDVCSRYQICAGHLDLITKSAHFVVLSSSR